LKCCFILFFTFFNLKWRIVDQILQEITTLLCLLKFLCYLNWDLVLVDRFNTLEATTFCCKSWFVHSKVVNFFNPCCTLFFQSDKFNVSECTWTSSLHFSFCMFALDGPNVFSLVLASSNNSFTMCKVVLESKLS
jgi:hypothetical protein